jgi:hypothetical protein
VECDGNQKELGGWRDRLEGYIMVREVTKGGRRRENNAHVIA